MTIEEVISKCLSTGISCIAVTDHGAIEGALLAQRQAPFKVIVGEEILTKEGEVLGLFLKQTIPNGLPLLETALKVKEQGGLLGVPHPFDPLRGMFRAQDKLKNILTHLDLLEVFNSRSLIFNGSSKAKKFCLKYKLPGSAGSDAHSPGEIGMSYVEMEDFNSPASFLASLSRGHIKGKRSSFLVHIRTFTSRRIKGLLNPGNSKGP